MGTLMEFITLTKGIEYLLAIAFLLAFVGFWQWQQHEGKGVLVKVLPVFVLAAGFGGLASTLIGTTAVATSRSEEWASVDDAHYLANIFGPAKFAAHEMGPDIISCQTCHHHSPDGQPSPCKDCHTEPFDGKSPDKPGLKAAYHQRCMDCHREAIAGPMTCTKCHTEKAESAEFKKKSPSPAMPPSISHPLLDRYANCFGCHNPEGPLPLPGNHSSYKANVVCLGCHKPSERRSTSLIPAVTTRTAAPPTATLTLLKEATTVPAETSNQQAPDASPTAASTATAVPQATSNSAGPTAAPPTTPPTTAARTTAPGRITHPVAGRENCLMCHKPGTGVKPAPADHAGRGNESCQPCHRPTT